MDKFEASRERAYKRVLERAVREFESVELAETWINSHVPALAGDRPIDVLKSEEGERLVMSVLDKIETGDFS